MKNNRAVIVSAPGKLMLMGEHAAVYGYPCIVTAAGKRIIAKTSATDEAMFRLDAPDVHITEYKKSMKDIGNGEIPKEARCAELTVKHFLDMYPKPGGISVQTHADFSSQVGFGSSSASIVSILCALVKLFNISISEKDLFSLSREIVLSVQGQGSGFDVAAALWGGTLFFEKYGSTIDPLALSELPIVVGYSGTKADTGSLIAHVGKLKEKYPEKVNRIFSAIERLVREARSRLTEADWERAGTLMDFNQEYLRDLGVSSEPLETLISSAKKAGAWGAKLSGAGGGDCIIAVYPKGAGGKEAVSRAIQKAGGTLIDVPLSAAGVRAEKGEIV